MFAPLWPELPSGDRPVGAITNGVHVPSWVSPALGRVFDRHLSPAWRDHYEDEGFWARVRDIPDEDLWDARQALRDYLAQFVRERARRRWVEDPTGANRLVASGVMLDPRALTIGFARRFTAYKRPELVFRDLDRLVRLVANDERPVQLVFAGKAHPADEAGKHQLQAIFRHALDPRLVGRVAFVDDYDLHVAHFLVQGCDVWLNTPRKPLEASGTSGMKAAMNGVLHASIGDGWWAEGYTGRNGWLIDGGADPADHDATDDADANALYHLLEREIVPAFYDRDALGVPRGWLARVKEAIVSVTPRFSTRRMLKDYVEQAYAPAFRPTPRALPAPPADTADPARADQTAVRESREGPVRK
jgi:starch phosphorylase